MSTVHNMICYYYDEHDFKRRLDNIQTQHEPHLKSNFILILLKQIILSLSVQDIIYPPPHSSFFCIITMMYCFLSKICKLVLPSLDDDHSLEVAHIFISIFNYDDQSNAFLIWYAALIAPNAATIPAGITLPVFIYLEPMPSAIKELVPLAKE